MIDITHLEEPLAFESVSQCNCDTQAPAKVSAQNLKTNIKSK